MYKPLLINVSVSLIVSGVQPHMTLLRWYMLLVTLQCLALHPRTDARKEMLEMVMLLEDAPEGEEVVASIEGDTPLMDGQ